MEHQIMAQAQKTIAKKKTSSPNGRSKSAVKTYQNYIGGEWLPSASGERFENLNPADTRDVVGRFALGSSEDVEAAIDAARSAA
ncbi:MAG TPA: hypothetical protein VM870_03130, partial [Pyrinomonadaceae bacterium]|nr:hypothetical protein [Pyrinomonadaceae bacterium]